MATNIATTTNKDSMKRKRAQNWTRAEEEQLKDSFLLLKAVLECQTLSSDMNRRKKQAWEKVAEEVNAIGGKNRNSEECRKKWSNLKSQTKSKIVAERREHCKTGGGKFNALQLSSFEESVAAAMAEEQLFGISGAYNSAAPASCNPQHQQHPENDDKNQQDCYEEEKQDKDQEQTPPK